MYVAAKRGIVRDVRLRGQDHVDDVDADIAGQEVKQITLGMGK